MPRYQIQYKLLYEPHPGDVRIGDWEEEMWHSDCSHDTEDYPKEASAIDVWKQEKPIIIENEKESRWVLGTNPTFELISVTKMKRWRVGFEIEQKKWITTRKQTAEVFRGVVYLDDLDGYLLFTSGTFRVSVALTLWQEKEEDTIIGGIYHDRWKITRLDKGKFVECSINDIDIDYKDNLWKILEIQEIEGT